MADVLFLDFNNSPLEIAAARRAAEKRGEAFYLFPEPLSAAEKEKYQKLKKESDLLFRQVDLARQTKNEIQISNISAKIEEVNDELSKVTDKRLTAESLKLYVEKNPSLRPSAVIMSGHDGNSNYTGTFGSLNVRDFGTVMGERAADVRSLYLWGCYTSTPAEILNSWKNATPNVSVVTGFEGKGPSNTRPANMAYLEDVLIKEKKLLAEADGKKVVELIRSANGFNQMSTATCVNDIYVTPQKVHSMKDIAESCMQPLTGKVKAQIANYKCMRHAAKANCSEPPKDTSHSELREFYSYIQSHKHCIELNPEIYGALPLSDEILHMIFYRQVIKNFERNYGDILFEMNQLLHESGAPANIGLKDLSKVSRYEFLQQLNRIREFVIQRAGALDANSPLDSILLNKLSAIENTLYSIYNVFFPPEAMKIPMSWVVRDSTEKPKDFLNKDRLGRKLEQLAADDKMTKPRDLYIEVQSRLLVAQTAGRDRTSKENMQLQLLKAERNVRNTEKSIQQGNELLSTYQAELESATKDADKTRIEESIKEVKQQLEMAHNILNKTQKPDFKRLLALKSIQEDPLKNRNELMDAIVYSSQSSREQALKSGSSSSTDDEKDYTKSHIINQYYEARYNIAVKHKSEGKVSEADASDLALKTWSMRRLNLQSMYELSEAINSPQLMADDRRRIADHEANKEKYIQEQMGLIRDVTSTYWHEELAESANPTY